MGQPAQPRSLARLAATRNPSLAYWNQRWGEDNQTWDTVLFPVDDWVLQSAARLEGSPYKGKPVTPEGAKTKDFREWHDGVFNFIARTLTGTLKGVRPDVLVGQRVDIWHYGDYRQNTWAVGLVDFYFQGGYSEKPEDARDPGPFIEREVRNVTDRWPRPMPIVFWETGMNIHDLPTAELDELQALQIVATDKKVKALDLSGWMWWTWRGYCMGKAALNFGIVRADGTPRPAVLALTRETHGKWGTQPVILSAARFTRLRRESASGVVGGAFLSRLPARSGPGQSHYLKRAMGSYTPVSEIWNCPNDPFAKRDFSCDPKWSGSFTYRPAQFGYVAVPHAADRDRGIRVLRRQLGPRLRRGHDARGPRADELPLHIEPAGRDAPGSHG